MHGSKAWRSDSSKCDPLFKVISGRSVNTLRRHGWVEIVFSDYAREDVLHVTTLGMYGLAGCFLGTIQRKLNTGRTGWLGRQVDHEKENRPHEL